jgi:peptidoglycan/LPS O-acetylase OafA/YrhL
MAKTRTHDNWLTRARRRFSLGVVALLVLATLLIYQAINQPTNFAIGHELLLAWLAVALVIMAASLSAMRARRPRRALRRVGLLTAAFALWAFGQYLGELGHDAATGQTGHATAIALLDVLAVLVVIAWAGTFMTSAARRVREDLRGGLPVQVVRSAPPSTGRTTAQRLAELEEAYGKGLLPEEAYRAKRQGILDEL